MFSAFSSFPGGLTGRHLLLLPFSVCCAWWPGALLSSSLQHLLSPALLPLSLSCPLQEERFVFCAEPPYPFSDTSPVLLTDCTWPQGLPSWTDFSFDRFNNCLIQFFFSGLTDLLFYLIVFVNYKVSSLPFILCCFASLAKRLCFLSFLNQRYVTAILK